LRHRRPARGSEEFVRVLGFSDGLFAIAMTLLVVSVSVPVLHDENSVHELLDDLNHRSAEIVSFFISFVVIGRYWVAHHRFFALIGAFDYGLIAVNLVYLAFVAFLPFPTALLGNYFDNPLSVIVYALNIAVVSGLEVLLMQRAHRSGLFERPMPAGRLPLGDAGLQPAGRVHAPVGAARVRRQLAGRAVLVRLRPGPGSVPEPADAGRGRRLVLKSETAARADARAAESKRFPQPQGWDAPASGTSRGRVRGYCAGSRARAAIPRPGSPPPRWS
jgi:uncharacterized membrane protein